MHGFLARNSWKTFCYGQVHSSRGWTHILVPKFSSPPVFEARDEASEYRLSFQPLCNVNAGAPEAFSISRVFKIIAQVVLWQQLLDTAFGSTRLLALTTHAAAFANVERTVKPKVVPYTYFGSHKYYVPQLGCNPSCVKFKECSDRKSSWYLSTIHYLHWILDYNYSILWISIATHLTINS